jgi:hypothetical protein
MAQSSTIDQIRQARDNALAALKSAIKAVSKKIELTTDSDDELEAQLEALMDQREAIEAAATDAVLALPQVIAAAAKLNALSAEMKATAQELPIATNALTKTAAVLALGQQFSEVLASGTQGPGDGPKA